MPSYDPTTILGGTDQQITDWVYGDDRIFVGDAQLSTNPPPPNDLNLTNAYWTLKSSPSQADQDSIVQVMVSQVLNANGQITAGLNAALSYLTIHIYSASYQSFVYPGSTYYWDFRCFTQNGTTLTLATGTVQFLPSVTQTDVAGTPANLPNSGNPSFRGFSAGPPAGGGPYNAGDWYVNRYPQPGDPWGWSCVIGGAPGIWVSAGVLGDISGTPQPPQLPPMAAAVPPPRFLGWIAAAPVTGGPYYVGDFYRNLIPSDDSASGWTCITAGNPGVWRTDGIVGETP